MVASDSFADFLRDQLAPLGRVTFRRMFGKTGVFCDGLMFAMVADDTLYVRVDAQSRGAVKEAESAPPLSYRKQGRSIDLAFWPVPELESRSWAFWPCMPDPLWFWRDGCCACWLSALPLSGVRSSDRRASSRSDRP